jgi:hypothetical protein
VSWAVNVGVVTFFGFILNVCGVDGDTALTFFGSSINVRIGLLLG